MRATVLSSTPPIRRFRSISPLLLAMAFGATSQAQVFTTVFQENFTHGTTTNNPSSGSVSATSGWVAGNDVVINNSRWRSYTSGQHGARIVVGRLQITGQRASNTAHAQGMAYVICGGTGSSFDNTLYNPVLKNNTGLVRWSFNIQRGPANNGGFGCSSTINQNNVTAGGAYILATNNPAGMMGNTSTCDPSATAIGYAVTVGNGQPTRLVRFDQGLHNSNHTVIASGPNISVTNVRSVRVTYDPANDQWTLSTRSDQSGTATSAYPDPLGGTGFSAPAAGVDGVHTTTTLNYQGAYNQAGCIGVCDYVGAGESSSTNPTPHGYFSNFDNITVAVEECTPLPAPGPIAGTITVCQGENGTYSIDPITGATSYAWAYSGTGVSIQPSGASATLTFTAAATSGTLSVNVLGGCTTQPSQVNITVGPLPSAPGTITGDVTLCEGTSAVYSVTDVAGNWYEWTLPAGWNGTSDSNSISVTAGTAGGPVTVTPVNACGSGPSGQIKVTVAPTPVVTLAAFDQVCVYHASFALSGGSPAGGTYVVQGTPTVSFDPSTGIGTYTVTYTYTDVNGCSGSASNDIMVDACTGVEELETLQVAIFPNPATDMLIIRADRAIREARLFDASGRLVLETSLAAGPLTVVQLDLSTAAEGVHILEVVTTDGHRTRVPVIKDR